MSILCEQTPVVILAGGKGTRLMPYTTSLPKPLMPVGDYPILDILLRQLANQGFRRVTLAVGHLAGLIQAYFKEGEDWGIEIEYAHETTPLGTAGPIARCPDMNAHCSVNGDLLTTMDFGKIVRFHYENRAVATIGTKLRTDTVPFGVVETASNGQIVEYKEKPDMHYQVSMGSTCSLRQCVSTSLARKSSIFLISSSGCWQKDKRYWPTKVMHTGWTSAGLTIMSVPMTNFPACRAHS